MDEAPISPKRRRRRTLDRPADTAVAYVRVSTEEQAASGAGLEGQRAAIEAYAASRGWTVTAWCSDEGVSGASAPEDRPQLRAALQALRDGHASVLLFHRVDRLARKTADLLALRDAAEADGWSLSAADGSVDLTTPHGRTMFTMQGAFAELERDLIRARTRDALAALKARGVRLGRPSTLPVEVVARIVGEHVSGAGWSAIAAKLNADQVPTAQGGKQWWPATVRKVVAGQDAAAYLAA
ncbi:recombinase [Streptomyces sp. TLI_235]|nr:recombinase family protein [Streptomyces sp. TLI_235]PBC77587.1 recombinase [Streptomyces sp. TLI_235]